MDPEKNAASRIPARVIGCLNRTTIRVIVLPGVGLADGGIILEVPREAVPMDLRIPNSEFDITFDKQEWANMKVTRKGELILES